MLPERVMNTPEAKKECVTSSVIDLSAIGDIARGVVGLSVKRGGHELLLCVKSSAVQMPDMPAWSLAGAGKRAKVTY